MPRRKLVATPRSFFERSPFGAALTLIAIGAASTMFACSDSSSESDDSNTGDDAFTSSQQTFWKDLELKLAGILDATPGPGNWKTPAPQNRWARNFSPTRVGQENVLADEPATFAKMARDIENIQLQLQESNGGYQRAFHAKPHACVKGKFFVHVPDTLVTDANLPASTELESLKIGILADGSQPRDVWVRWSNGVGGAKRPDGEADVRGLALKVLDVEGDRLGDGNFFKQEKGTQDFLMTNGATTPAPDSEAFAAFGVTQANMATASGPLAKGRAIGNFLDYLVKNPRVGSTLLKQVLADTKAHNSVVGQRFFSGGAIALGVDANANAREAIKFSAVTGHWTGDANGQGRCVPATDDKQALKDFVLPGGEPLPGADPNYLSTGQRLGVKTFLKAGQVCIDFRIQFQRHDDRMLRAQAQPIEDTTVAWLERDSPWVSVATVVIPQLDDPSSDEALCNKLSWNPWHSLKDHRPLGNIMRARQEVLAASAGLREAKLLK